jgi:hypothetical protein
MLKPTRAVCLAPCPPQAQQALSETFPEQMMVMNDNLKAKVEADMKFELTDALDKAQLSPLLMDKISQCVHA